MMSERIRFSLTLIVLTATVSTVAILLRPALAEVNSAKRNLLLSEKRLARAQQIQDTFESVQKTFIDNAELVSRSEKALPSLALDAKTSTASDVPQLLELLQDMTKREAPGTIIRSARIATLEGGDSSRNTLNNVLTGGSDPWEAKPRPLTLEGVGSYDGLKRFLNATASSLRILEPTSLSFTIDTEHEIVDFKIDVDAYVQLGCNRANCQNGAR